MTVFCPFLRHCFQKLVVFAIVNDCVVYTFLNVRIVYLKSFKRLFWTVFSNSISAKLMSLHDVFKVYKSMLIITKSLPWTSPSLKSFPFIFLCNCVYTVLSNIFLKNLKSTKSLFESVLRCTIFSITHAIFLFKFFITSWTSPCNKHWLEINLFNNILQVLWHISDKI